MLLQPRNVEKESRELRSRPEAGKRMSKLEWKLLTKRRARSAQGVPPGKEDLGRVINTVTLIDVSV